MKTSGDLKSTLVKHLSVLPDLYMQQRNYASRWDKEWLVGEELAEYEGLREITAHIAQQVDEAGQSILREKPIYPEEYQVLLAQLAELKPSITQIDTVRSALVNLNFIEFPQARVVSELFFPAFGREEVKYRDLTKTKKRKERMNSKVVKIRLAAYEVYKTEVAKIRTQTRDRLEIKYADSLKRKGELERLARNRKQAKLRPINTQIRELLNTAIQLEED